MLAGSVQVSTGTKTSLSFQDGPVFTRVHRREGPAAPRGSRARTHGTTISQPTWPGVPDRLHPAHGAGAGPATFRDPRGPRGLCGNGAECESPRSRSLCATRAPQGRTATRPRPVRPLRPDWADWISATSNAKPARRAACFSSSQLSSIGRFGRSRDWRTLHIGVDAEGFIVAAELTASSRDDASTLPALLDTIEVPIRRFTADGAYDHRSVYDQLSAAGTENVVIVIPPRRSAVSAGPTDGPWAQRDTALERIRQVGRREWQKESGYRQQARVENSFFRYKSVLGGGLKARHGKAHGSKERSCDRVSHPQPDGRAG